MSGNIVSENSLHEYKSLVRINFNWDEIFPNAVWKNKDFTTQPTQIAVTELCGNSTSTKNRRLKKFEQPNENVEGRQSEVIAHRLPNRITSPNYVNDRVCSQRNTEVIVISDDEESNFSMSFSSRLEEELMDENFDINSETIDELVEDEGHYGSHNSLLGLRSSSFTEEEIRSLLKRQAKMEELNVSLQQKFQAVQTDNKSREESLIKITTNVIEDLKEVCISLENNNSFISEIENDEGSTLEERLAKIQFCVSKINAEVMKKQKHMDLRPRNCTRLPNSFKGLSDLRKHVGRMHNSIIGSFKCDQCSSSFKLQSSLKIHIQRVHNPMRPFQCHECSSSFNLKANLKRHIQIVHNRVKSFQCHKCSSSFRLKRDLKRHVQEEHNPVKPFQCHKCSSSFKLKCYLKRHIQEVHNPVKPFQCHKCSSSFKLKCYLKSHTQEVHNPVRPFQCGECFLLFKRKGNLKGHIQEVHNQIRAFQCHECAALFKRKTDMSKHIQRVHMHPEEVHSRKAQSHREVFPV